MSAQVLRLRAPPGDPLRRLGAWTNTLGTERRCPLRGDASVRCRSSSSDTRQVTSDLCSFKLWSLVAGGTYRVPDHLGLLPLPPPGRKEMTRLSRGAFRQLPVESGREGERGVSGDAGLYNRPAHCRLVRDTAGRHRKLSV